MIDYNFTDSDRDLSWLDMEIANMESDSLLLKPSLAAPSLAGPITSVAPPLEHKMPMTSLTTEELIDILGEFDVNESNNTNEENGITVTRDVFEEYEPLPVQGLPSNDQRQQMTIGEDRGSTSATPKGVFPMQDKVSPPANFGKAAEYPFLQYDNTTRATQDISGMRSLFTGNPTDSSQTRNVAVAPSASLLSTIEEGSSSSSEDESTCKNKYSPKFRGYQCDQWQERYSELCKFYQDHGHSSVPHTDSPHKRLARWVKRQRYQYKLRQEGKPSAMTDERIKLLESLEFVWDSHGAAWEDRLKELEEFKAIHKHCNVPSNYKANSSLASWIKCQRRQYRLYREGKQSNITQARINQLEHMGFQFNPRVGYHHQRLLHSSKGWS